MIPMTTYMTCNVVNEFLNMNNWNFDGNSNSLTSLIELSGRETQMSGGNKLFIYSSLYRQKMTAIKKREMKQT
jgi:hypothetical protein